MNPSAAPPQRPSLLPAIIGFMLAGILIITLGFWTAARRRSAPQHPVVTLLNPARDTLIAGQLILRFESTIPLQLQPTGWGSGRYHLHALVNGQELMPAASDITRASNGYYQWRLTGLPDSAVIQLVWALPSHRRLPSGASAIIHVH